MARERQIAAQSWGTLEELLLACAVNRHGTKSWDSVATELQNRRTSALSSLTPQLCKDKFKDLTRRFISQNDVDLAPSGLVDQLRRIRVEELRREVQRRDDSIVSLELTVKKLEEERDKADLGREADLLPEIVAGKPAVDEDSGERDDRSFNESNSTSEKPEPKMVKNERNDVVEADEGEEDGKVRLNPEPDGRKEPGPVQPEIEPAGGRVDDDDDNRKQSSDVQSSASLPKNKRRRNRGGACGNSSGAEEPQKDEVSPANKQASAAKSEPLIKLIGMIRSHRLGPAFERRQRSQESKRYKSLIRQPIDLQTIQSRLKKGLYSKCTQKFFRDLLLLLNNFTVFHRKNSQEHIAAKELLVLVQKEMLAILPPSKPAEKPAHVKTEPDKKPVSSVSKPVNKSSAVVACNERSSVKTVSENAGRKGDKEKKDKKEKPKVIIDEKKCKEGPVTGQRNSRTSSKSGGEVKHEYGGNELSSHDAKEIKMEKKESVAKKKQGAVSFLKRMKQNSPSDEVTEDEYDVSEDEKGRGRKREVIEKEKVTRSSGGRGAREESGRGKKAVGRPPKRAAVEVTVKKGRENGESEAGSRGRKRTRR